MPVPRIGGAPAPTAAHASQKGFSFFLSGRSARNPRYRMPLYRLLTSSADGAGASHTLITVTTWQPITYQATSHG